MKLSRGGKIAMRVWHSHRKGANHRGDTATSGEFLALFNVTVGEKPGKNGGKSSYC